MSPELWAILIQTVVLVVTFIGFMLRREHRITKVEGRVDAVEDSIKPLPGISRAVARLEGKLHRQ